MSIGLDQINRIRASLLTSNIQRTNNALYQSILGLIQVLTGVITASGSSSGGSVTNVTNEFFTSGFLGLDGNDGEDGVPGVQGINGATGIQGPVGPVIIPEDGIDGLDGMNIAVPGQAGNNGATGDAGPVGPVLVFSDGEDGLDGFPGIPGVNGADGSTDLIRIHVDIDSTAMSTINTSPVTLVAAQGANTIIQPVWWTIEDNISVVFSNAPTWHIGYAVAPTTAILATLTLAVNALGHKYIAGASNNPANPSFTLGTTDIRNQALVFQGNANVSGAGTGSLRVHLVYTVVSTI